MEEFKADIPKLPGTKVVGNIKIEEKPIKYPKEELELRGKIGFQFDKVWKDKHKTRLQMQIWAIHLFELKIKPEDFSLNKLSYEQVKVLGLKLKFEFNV